MKLTIDECKVLWVVGAAERLASLGVFCGEVPVRVSNDAVDIFVEIDEHRDKLFVSDFEVAQIFKAMATSESHGQIGDEDMSAMIDFILEYKNNRTDLVRKALSRQIA